MENNAGTFNKGSVFRAAHPVKMFNDGVKDNSYFQFSMRIDRVTPLFDTVTPLFYTVISLSILSMFQAPAEVPCI